MATRDIVQNTTSFIGKVFLRDSTTGLGKTGVADTSMSGDYCKDDNSADTALSFAAGSVGDSYSSGKWAEIGNGYYFYHYPNGCWTTLGETGFSFRASGTIDAAPKFRVILANFQAADPFGGSVVSASVAGNVGGNVVGSVASVTGAVGSVTGAVASVTGNVGGNVTGSVGSVVGGINTGSGTITTLDALDTAQDNQHSTTQTNVSSVGTLVTTVDTVVDGIATQIGTAGNGLSNIPWNASWDSEVESECNDALVAIHLDHLLAVAYDATSKPGAADALLNEMVEDDAGVTRYTVNALENGPSGSGASAASIADAVWEELISDHSGTSGSTAAALAAAGSAGDPWTTALPGSYTGSQAGKILADVLVDTADLQANQGNWLTATGFSTHSAADVWAHATRVLTANTNLAILDAAGIRAAIGMASANLDTQLGNLQASVDSMPIEVASAIFVDAAWIGLTDDVTQLLSDVISVSSAVMTIASYVDTEIASIKVVTDKLNTALEADGASGWQYTALAMENGPAGGGGGGGDATAANQAIIVDHLTSLKGAGFDTALHSAKAIRERGDVAWLSGSAGSGSESVDITVDDGTDPIQGAVVQISTSDTGTPIVAGPVAADAAGIASVRINPGIDYFIFVQLNGYTFPEATPLDTVDPVTVSGTENASGGVIASDLYSMFGQSNIRRWADLDNDEDATKIDNRIAQAVADVTSEVYDELRGHLDLSNVTSVTAVRRIITRLSGIDLYSRRGIEDDNPAIDNHRKIANDQLQRVISDLARTGHTRVGKRYPGVIAD